MGENLLKSLGLTKEQLRDLVVERIVNDVMESSSFDEDGEHASRFHAEIQNLVRKVISEKVIEIGEKHIAPRVGEMIDGITLQETNKWGEAKGASVTFVEYLVQRAEAYMTEEVNFEGKAKGQDGCYSWSKVTTRIAYMIDKHLHYQIVSAMKTALSGVNEKIAGGIVVAVKIALEEVQKKLKIEVNTR